MIDVIQIPWSKTGGPVFQRGFSGRDGEDEAISSRKRNRLEIVIAWLGPRPRRGKSVDFGSGRREQISG